MVAAVMQVRERNTFIEVVETCIRQSVRRRTEPASLLSAEKFFLPCPAEHNQLFKEDDDCASDASTDAAEFEHRHGSKLSSDSAFDIVSPRSSVVSREEAAHTSWDPCDQRDRVRPDCGVGYATHACVPEAGAANLQIMGFAARALRVRMESALGVPSWACHLPSEAMVSMGWQTRPTAVSRAGDSEERAYGTTTAAEAMGVTGRVWILSKCPQGCRQVQLAFDRAANDGELADLARELRGHVWEALQCPHANHVLQKCISTMKPKTLQFIIDELMSRSNAPSKASAHKYGCRVVQRLLERCAGEQVYGFVNSVLSDAHKLVSHAFGNYVLQQILKYGAPEQREHLFLYLERNVAQLALNPYAGAIVSMALATECDSGRVGITRAVLQVPGLLAKMSIERQAYLGVKAILSRHCAEQQIATAQLNADTDLLHSTRYGRLIRACLN